MGKGYLDADCDESGYPFVGIHFLFPLGVFTIYSNSKPVKKDDTLVNEQIRFREVLIIGREGQQFGVRTIKDALFIAMKEGLDLVCVAPTATPPVCKLLDYSKYRYELQRKAREAKKNQRIVELKEIRLTAVIDTHDFETKVRNGVKFLDHGDKLKVSVRLPNRAPAPLVVQGKDVLNQFAALCAVVGDIEKDIVHEGRYLTINLTPKKKPVQAQRSE